MVEILTFLFNAYGVGALMVSLGLSARMFRRCVQGETTPAEQDKELAVTTARILLWPKYLWRPW